MFGCSVSILEECIHHSCAEMNITLTLICLTNYDDWSELFETASFLLESMSKSVSITKNMLLKLLSHFCIPFAICVL